MIVEGEFRASVLSLTEESVIKLIWKMLKAGYMEDWRYNATYSGTPQGGILSPLLANIYLHELDKFVMQMAKEFYQKSPRSETVEYKTISHKLYSISRRIKKSTGEERLKQIEEYKALKKVLLKTPSKQQSDKKIKYVRYADDFIIGVNGSKEDCIEIKSKLSEFIATRLKMTLSEEKTLITHSSECARFLG